MGAGPFNRATSMSKQDDELEQDLNLDEEDTDLEDENGKTGDEHKDDDKSKLTDEEWEAQEKERLAGLTPEELAEEALKKSKTNRRLYGRIQKSKNKKPVTQPEVKKPETNKVTPPVTAEIPKYVTPDELDEKILQSTKGYDAEAMDELKSIAKGKGISLIQAEQDTLFKLFLDAQEAEKKKKKAKLGPSTGSGTGTNSKGFKPGMTKEEHRKAWEARQQGQEE